MKRDIVLPELFQKPKYVATSFPVIVALIAFATDCFSVLANSIWFWALYAAYYTFLFVDRWSGAQVRKWQEDQAKNFIYPEIPTEISVLTYNIFLRPPFVKNNFDDFKNERLKGFIETVLLPHRFDVILLQEIFSLGNTRQRKLLQIARNAGYKFHVRGVGIPLFDKKFVDAGLLILSKYPIVERDALLYKNGNQIDSWAAKQMIYAKVRVGKNQFFHVFTTHMQASYYDSSASQNLLNDRSRLGQVDELSDFVHSKIHGSAFPALVAGDFNIHAREGDEESREYKYLISKLNRDGESCSPAHCPVRDLLKEHSGGKHPNTYADVHPHGGPKETVLTHKADIGSALSIDHCLWIDTVTNARSGAIRVKDESTHVEEFLVNPSAHPFTQLSDHYGVSTIVSVDPTLGQ